MRRVRTARIGINGFGRMGRLALRAGWERPELEFARVNEVKGDAETAAHLLTFDSVHGRWDHEVTGVAGLSIDGAELGFSSASTPGEAVGRASTSSSSAPENSRRPSPSRRTSSAVSARSSSRRRSRAARSTSSSASTTTSTSPARHDLITAASCTTNCLAPIVKVIHEGIGIEHGSITTLHDMTNTQIVVDAPHKDLRRARAASLSLIPTTTGSATAIGLIFPELEGKLDGLAVRVPMLNASLTDCVFEVARPTDVEEVNGLLEAAANGLAARHPRLRRAAACLGRLQGRPPLRRSSTRPRRWSSTGPR